MMCFCLQGWNPLGVIPWSSVQAIQAVPEEHDREIFKIVTPQREYLIMAASKEVKDEWIAVGNAALITQNPTRYK
jgi:hypothetical protein